MNKFRALAISELERMGELTPLQKVQLGRTCKISSWVVQGFKEFVSASSSIAREDAVVLALGSIYTTYRLNRIREKMSSPGSALGIAHNLIEDEFRDELSEIRSHEETFKVAEPDIPFPIFGNAEDTFEFGRGKKIPLIPQPTESFSNAFGTPAEDDFGWGRGPFQPDDTDSWALNGAEVFGGAELRGVKKKKKKK